MSGPIVFISHFKVKEGKLESLKGHAQGMIELIKAEKPGTLAFLQYLNIEFHHMPQPMGGYIRFKSE